MIWLLLVVMAILMWSSTCLLYKAGVHDENEEHICLKFSVCIGVVFFVIALVYLIIREEEFTIFESAVRYWPMTVFGILYAIVNTISFKGYVYNEATVESPIEGISGGVSTILLILTYVLLGRVNSIAELLNKELSGVQALTLNFTECDYVSSAGLRVLLATFKKMKAAKGSMVLTNVGENFMDVLSNTGLDAVFDLQ